jgi:hypothetical protein
MLKIFGFLVVFLVPLVRPGWAQFTAAELAERPRWESFLREAEVVEQDQLSRELGVTKPWKLTLRQGDVVRRALWKNPSGIKGGFLEGWKYEIAAYRMDKLLGIDMVPPTVEREFVGSPGSGQLWIDDTSLYRDMLAVGKSREPFRTEAWKKAGYISQLFDNLIGNEDRHLGNVLVTGDFRALLIDHSRTFRTMKSFVEGLPFSDKNIPPVNLMRKLPRSLVDRVSALSESEVREAVGELLSDEEIRAVMARKKLLVAEIQKIIVQFGADDVLY